MRKAIWLGAVAVLIPAAHAQESFQDYVASQREEFQAFREARDKEFHQFLQARWEAFQVDKGEREDPAPKPDSMPEAQPEPVSDPAPEPIPADRVAEPAPDTAEQPPPAETPSTASEPQPEEEPGRARGDQPEPESRTQQEPGLATDHEPESMPEREPAPAPEPAAPSGESVEVAFLGHSLNVAVPAAWDGIELGRADKQAVADFWADFAKAPTKPVVAELEQIRERLNLNGWGYLKLTQALAESVHGSGNTAVATTWGLLLKSGYDARVGYADGELLLLYRPEEKLFDTPYFDLDGRRYYLFGGESGSVPRLHTYAADYQGADSGLAVAVTQPPKVKGAGKERTLRFEFQGETHRVSVSLQPALLDYLGTVPQLAVERYFTTESRPGLEAAVVEPLRQASADMDRVERVNFLLRFAQTAFEYQTDQKQFGREDYLYPEETLFYPA
ncbi:MAG TPA: hypothetical protein VJ985_05105, partial [Gammaproteobacteria bacterium]|nr:hypothetical protein [Gammaproteobacteria bacterium]